MQYFPIFYDLKDRLAVVVGGGEEATRKIRLLLKTEARIGVIAPRLADELAAEPRVEWLARRFSPDLLDGAAIAFSADAELNETVSQAARARCIPVNTVDVAELSTFIVPSIVDRDPVVVAIGTEGTAPVLALGLRARIDALLPSGLGRLASAAAALRQRVGETLPAGRARRSFWQKVFFGPARDAFLSGDRAAFRNEVEAALAEESVPAPGRVSLVGAGPGDPELLTLKAQRKLQEADVIVHDRLIGPQILELARRDAVRIAVGKTPYRPSPRQEEINDILVREAKAGRNVVRLKGGDPYVFGRGAEEQAALEAAGIAFDVVPGITAALGCAAIARMPLTQRGRNQSFTLLTGTSEDGTLRHDWRALAASGSAFAVYMGVREAGTIADNLLEAGMSPATPVTIVENGSLAEQRIVHATIGRLGETILSESIAGPAIIFVGLSAAQASADIVPFPTREDLREAALRAAS